MTYEQTLDWMFAQLPMYQQKGPSALNNKLDNIQSFAKLLNNPEKKFKSIHVAGTNGKGSSCHMLASVLQEAGYKVGLYTSPHLKDFRERIKINGIPVTKGFVIDFIEAHKPYLEQNRLSFFEMGVGMAFSYFAESKVDIAAIEVGLGGRLDSTNIIHPEVSLITNIGLDHTHILGDSLGKIAYEKAGIIKNGVPVVIGEHQPETAPIFEEIASERDAQIIFADPKVGYKTDLLGDYQVKNISGVLACLEQLKGFDISENAIKRGLQNVVRNTGLMGRWQLMGERPKIVADAAHNSNGIQVVLNQIQKEEYDALHFVLGFVKDKDVEELLSLFPERAKYYFVCPEVPRGLDALQLKRKANEIGLIGEIYPSVRGGLESAKANASDGDFIYVGGSTFVVAEIV